jgi:type VI secretion system protein ImpG
MDPRLLDAYNQELRYLREMGAEFAQEFPKIASRLSLDGFEVADPYVERLLEGCAFLAARIQIKLDAEFPRLSRRLLEMLSPNFLAPVPAMLVAQLQPKVDPNLLAGHVLPGGSMLTGRATPFSDTRCLFRTAHAVTLTPLSTVAVEVLPAGADSGGLSLGTQRVRGAVRVKLALPAGMRVAQLAIDSLRFHLGGQPDVAMKLYELLAGACLGAVVGPVMGAPGRGSESSRRALPAAAVKAVGFGPDEALLPVTGRGLDGTRLMQEYFAFPQRFLFIELSGLRPLWQGIAGNEVEITWLLRSPATGCEGVVDAGNFALHCVPAVNLFTKRADRMAVTTSVHEYHVVPDRAAPLDFEVFDVTGVTGHAADNAEQAFHPLYAGAHDRPPRARAFYTVDREPRLPSEKTRREGGRSGYHGSEVYLSLVDGAEAPLSEALRQISVATRCTNRDLPLFMPLGAAESDLTLDVGAPVLGIRVVAGPSRPRSALRDGPAPWRLLNLLSLNHQSLIDDGGADGGVDGGAKRGDGKAAGALRELLSLFAAANDAGIRRQIEGLHQVSAQPVVRRHPVPGPIAFGRGVEVMLTLDDLAFEGASALLFGSVLHHHLARHVSMNSFVQTVVATLARGAIAQLGARLGQRALL